MFIKRTILSSIMAACLGQVAMAVPAYPRPIVVQQADGSYVTVTIQGDEHGHIALADDGEPLCFNGATGNYEYATIQNGIVVPSGVKAENAAQRSLKTLAFLKKQNRGEILHAYRQQYKEARVAVSNTDMRINDFPTTGVQHSLVVLVQFSDCPFTTVGTDVKQFYENMLNKEGFTYSNGAKGSARDFYVASSNGQFLPTFDVVGPITLPKSYSYYGENVGTSRDNETRLAEFVKEACKQADPLVDFSQYDHDGDGVVDNVFFYFAGYGEADSGKSNTIWPHATDYRVLAKNAGVSTELVLDGKQIGSYTCTNEINGTKRSTPQPTGIGTFVHEFGHVLGLADHYDSSATSAAEAFHPGAYDTMATGSYNNDGNTPPTFSAFERASLGWLNYEELNASSADLQVLPDLQESNKAYRVSVNGTMGKEFFVLENRQQTGWDAFLPGHGMLMWHIDYDENAWKNNEVNIDNTHQRIDIVEADNRRTESSRAGDTFPGTSNVTKWNMTSWGDEVVFKLDDIEEKDGVINLMAGGLDLKLNAPSLSVANVTEESAAANWTAVPIAKEYVLNLYKVVNDKKTAVAAYTNRIYTDPTTVSLENLEPETQYQLTLQAQRGSYTSDVVTTDFQTTAIPFAKLYPANLKVKDVTSDSFTASWDAVKGADSYELTLGKVEYADEPILQGYDFTNLLSGMPELWQTNGSIINSTYGEAAPALRMFRDDSYLTVAYADAQLSKIQFWAKCNSSADGNLLVQVDKDGEWETVQTISVDEDLMEGKVFDVAFDKTSKVRLYLERESGIFFVDDVVADCHKEETKALMTYDLKGSETTKVLSDLKRWNTDKLMVSVVAKQGTEKSLASNVLVHLDGATAIMTPQALEREGLVEYYDLNGRRISKSQLTHGVYIKKYGHQTYKVVY